MASTNGFSALLSLLLVLVCIAIGQIFKPILAESRQGNLAAGGYIQYIMIYVEAAIKSFYFKK